MRVAETDAVGVADAQSVSVCVGLCDAEGVAERQREEVAETEEEPQREGEAEGERVRVAHAEAEEERVEERKEEVVGVRERASVVVRVRVARAEDERASVVVRVGVAREDGLTETETEVVGEKVVPGASSRRPKKMSSTARALPLALAVASMMRSRTVVCVGVDQSAEKAVHGGQPVPVASSDMLSAGPKGIHSPPSIMNSKVRDGTAENTVESEIDAKNAMARYTEPGKATMVVAL